MPAALWFRLKTLFFSLPLRSTRKLNEVFGSLFGTKSVSQSSPMKFHRVRPKRDSSVFSDPRIEGKEQIVKAAWDI